MILLSAIKLMQNRKWIWMSSLVICFSLNSTTINQYLIILTFCKFLLQSAFRCWEGTFLFDKSLSWLCKESVSYKGVSHLLLWNNTLLLFNSTFNFFSLFARLATEDASFLRDIFILYLYLGYDDFFLFIFEESLSLCFVNMPFYFNWENLLLKEPNFLLWKTLRLRVSIVEPFCFKLGFVFFFNWVKDSFNSIVLYNFQKFHTWFHTIP